MSVHVRGLVELIDVVRCNQYFKLMYLTMGGGISLGISECP